MIQAATRNAAEKEILEFIQTRLRFTHHDVATYCEASDWTRQNFLRALQRQGVVTECGRNGTTQFYTVWGVDEAKKIMAAATGHELDTAWSRNRLDQLLGKMRETGADIELPSAEPRSLEEQQIWKYISERPYFTTADVETICASETIRTRFLSRLKQTGVMRVWGRSKGKVFFSVKSPEEAREDAKDKRSTKEGAVWTAIRHQKRFRPVDIFAALAPARPDIPQRFIVEYCRILRRAGYLRTAARTRNLMADTSLFLMKNTGPLPPQKRSMTVIIDTNDDKIVYAPGGRL
ncbi:hypothetical protein [Leisingera methylohalidivorans]|uniref:Uncharacterized protein n=1 Tax=Leisingera methylohalidivorans DSM 14336 TaxID=999552 RepID=V9VZ82_9RHOB|nr:hypothetical protein [Leisingera methylohalidivorans]AHD03089.1 hypothetical protein METH_11210 [Leisingera methylohalidivorans DSM 14336]